MRDSRVFDIAAAAATAAVADFEGGGKGDFVRCKYHLLFVWYVLDTQNEKHMLDRLVPCWTFRNCEIWG